MMTIMMMKVMVTMMMMIMSKMMMIPWLLSFVVGARYTTVSRLEAVNAAPTVVYK